MDHILLDRLQKVRPVNKQGQFEACCPAHNDKNPSLRVKITPEGLVLINCRTGCDPLAVLEAVGLKFSDLFPDGPLNAPAGYRSPWWAQQQRHGRDFDAGGVPHPKDRLYHERMVLHLAKLDRQAGKRLSRQDRERELLAFRRVNAR